MSRLPFFLPLHFSSSRVLGGGVFTSKVLAESSSAITATFIVGSACSIGHSLISAHTASLVPGVYSGSYTTEGTTPYANGIGTTRLTAFCNDNSGYSIYAVGYTGDVEGTNTLVGQSTGQTIASGTATSGNTSNWAMKVTKVTDTTESYNPTNLTIEGGYDAFSIVPSTYTKVVSYTSSTDSTLGSIVTTTYAAYIEPSAVADTYVGKVKYTLVHPSTNDLNHYYINFYGNGGTGSPYTQEVAKGSSIYLKGNHFTNSTGGNDYYFKGWTTTLGGTTVTYRAGQEITPDSDMKLYAVWGKSTGEKLYDVVASLSSGRELTNTTTNGTGLSASAGIQADITTDNSGVFIYNPTTFGEASDASSDHTIYLYRGILDDTFASTDQYGDIGSSGDSANYPNYVKLGSGENATCWRIVRTTGSGGVKMIYNGLYTGGTANSCANYQGSAQVASTSFNTSGEPYIYKSIVGVGYTYNPNYVGTTETTPYNTLFGTNSLAGSIGNSADSTIKAYIEGTWFGSANGVSAYESMLEGSAGYCNDRTIYNGSQVISDNTDIVTPYTTATDGVAWYQFGARARNAITSGSPSLTCPRNIVDLYTMPGLSTGNGQLAKPVALLTADEISFAGSGRVALQGPSYNTSAFLRSGSHFWSLSPYSRGSNSYAIGFLLGSYGYLDFYVASDVLWVRPAISLTYAVTISSGTGTATDPWEISW